MRKDQSVTTESLSDAPCVAAIDCMKYGLSRGVGAWHIVSIVAQLDHSFKSVIYNLWILNSNLKLLIGIRWNASLHDKRYP